MQEEIIKITKTDDQNGLEFFSIDLSIDEITFRELVEMYNLTVQQEAKAQGSDYLTCSTIGKSLTWNANAIKIKGFNPYVVINDLRGIKNPSASASPTTEEEAKKELELYYIKTMFVDNTDTSGIIEDMKKKL